MQKLPEASFCRGRSFSPAATNLLQFFLPSLLGGFKSCVRLNAFLAGFLLHKEIFCYQFIRVFIGRGHCCHVLKMVFQDHITMEMAEVGQEENPKKLNWWKKNCLGISWINSKCYCPSNACLQPSLLTRSLRCSHWRIRPSFPLWIVHRIMRTCSASLNHLFMSEGRPGAMHRLCTYDLHAFSNAMGMSWHAGDATRYEKKRSIILTQSGLPCWFQMSWGSISGMCLLVSARFRQMLLIVVFWCCCRSG